jgi:hypothetical protein
MAGDMGNERRLNDDDEIKRGEANKIVIFDSREKNTTKPQDWACYPDRGKKLEGW